MRDVMEALAELQAAHEAIESAGPLYQTREPLRDKILCLIGQRSDLITQVLALRRELDAAHARIRELEARAEAAEQERDELAANGAAIVCALEERDMARAERDEARARIRELEAVLDEARPYVGPPCSVPECGEHRCDLSRQLRALPPPVPGGKGRHCGETDPDGIGYVCTLPPGHDGGHVAHVLLGEVAHRWTTPTAPVGDADKQPRAPGCQCQWEAGDSPCPVHGEDEVALEERDTALLAPTTPTPAPTLTDAELRALREEGQRRRQRFEETLRRMQSGDAQRGGGQ